MLDYSDEEPEPVRRRTHSPSNLFGSGVLVKFRNADNKETPLKSQIAFGDDGSRQITPRTLLPTSDAFIINEFVRDKTLQPNSHVQSFDLSLKGKNFFSHKLPQNTLAGDGEDHPDSFFKSMTTIVFLSQFFAVLPVSGYKGKELSSVHLANFLRACAIVVIFGTLLEIQIPEYIQRRVETPEIDILKNASGANYRNVRFEWVRMRTCYWFLTLLGTLFCTACSIADTLNDGSFQAASELFFYVCGIISSLLMVNLSRNWRQLNREFAEAELKLRKYGYPKGISFKFKLFTVSVLSGALVEHILSKLKNFQTLDCYNRKGHYLGIIEAFFLREYYHVFSVMPFNLGLGFVLLAAQFLTTANWNFKDLILCLISWTIAERFKQIQDLLDSVHGQDKPVSFWKEIREDYNALTVLTKRVDGHVQNLMLLSLGNNVFFICIQLFRSFKKKLGVTKLVYFFWSFGFLILRASFVAFAAARINEGSKEPKIVLYSVPQKNYTAEVRRFLTQLTTNEVALTGSGFFSVTRSLILTITGTVITYVVVLAQFGDDGTEEVPINATICALLHA